METAVIIGRYRDVTTVPGSCANTPEGGNRGGSSVLAQSNHTRSYGHIEITQGTLSP